MLYFDYSYLIIVMPFALLAMYASIKVNTTFKRYAAMPLSRGTTGEEAARMVLAANGVTGVRIAPCQGHLTDHFDPRDNTIYLSEAVYSGRNAAACGVAAHEAGHAVQHAEEYFPIRVRSALVPITNLGSSLGIWLILIGLLLAMASQAFAYLAYLGIALFSLTAIFQLVTLPVEFNASRRAMAALEASGGFTEEETRGARSVLTAAAMTYVAALAVSLAQILRFLVLVAGATGRRRD